MEFIKSRILSRYVGFGAVNRIVKFSPSVEPSIKILCWFKSLLFNRTFHITISALALNCCKAHAKINGKIENSTPCKIVTNEDFNLKLGTRDYVANATHHATLGSNPSSGAFPPNRGNITPVWLFGDTVFFDPAPTSNRRTDCFAKGSNDVFPHKDGPFGGLDDGWRHMGKTFPLNSPKMGVNRQFQAKTPWSLHRNISGTINPTN